MFRRNLGEPPRVHVELVAALFTASLPLGVMVATFALVGFYVAAGSGDPISGVSTAAGCVAAAWKVGLNWLFRRSSEHRSLDTERAHIWERRFAAGNFAFAAAVGVLTARSFSLPEPGSQLLTTGMLFGFCSGQVARVAVRPHICSRSIAIAAVPAAIAAAGHGDVPHIGLAAMFVLFIVGGIESVRYAYGQIRQRIVANLELETVAGVDPLTGLGNRLGLRRAFENHARPQRSGDTLIAVHCFDLDGFKAVNDSLGHSTGDALLIELAARVRRVLRVSDIGVRLGGDEFLVVQQDVRHADEAEMFARRLCRAVTAPYDLNGRTMTIGMSLGSCTGRPPHDLLDDLIGAADAGMYAAKRSGGGIAPAARLGMEH